MMLPISASPLHDTADSRYRVADGDAPGAPKADDVLGRESAEYLSPLSASPPGSAQNSLYRNERADMHGGRSSDMSETEVEKGTSTKIGR